MARARNIKPGLYKNEDLAECSIFARWIFPGLWMLADRDGRMEDRPKRIKGELLPYDAIEVDPLLDELARFGFIKRYQVDGQRFIAICKFTEHQTPHVREQASSIPAPDQAMQSTTKAVPSTNLDSDEPSPRSPDSLIPLPITDSPIPHTSSKPAAPKDEEPKEFIEAWQAYPKRPGASRKDALKAWKARVASGADPETIFAGVKSYAKYVVAKQTEPEYIKQAATFFGPADYFKADWTVHAARAGPAKTSRHNGFDSVDYNEGVENGRIS